MTQSWNAISGFPSTPSPPRIPDTILGAWFQRPPIQFTRQMPPTQWWIAVPPTGRQRLPTEQPTLTRVHSFPAASLSCEFGHIGNNHSGSLDPTNTRRLQLIPIASETSTADASLLKFWWHQHLLLARNSAQERFATGHAGPTIISEHLQAFLFTAINLMKLARPEPTYEVKQPEGPALESLAETLLDTLQGTMTMEMKLGIAAGNAGEIVVEGDRKKRRLIFWRPSFGPQSYQASFSRSSTQTVAADEVEC